MKNIIFTQIIIICIGVIYVEMALQPIPTSKESIASDYKMRGLRRENRATTSRPGFFKTLFSVIYEQWDDTRQTSASIKKMIDDNFLPENMEKSQTTVPPGTNVSTTEDNRITRTELQRILLRNLRGLQKLFQVELNQALKQSEKTNQQFRKNVTKEVSKFL
ncbi:uncharacterized protein LOC130897186 [Diorhabda carinulata]|uniref:uncharacterized protein LOC130897186 n=1 Tax=Diorhabda carinulata TaxID=1163345 RepID=UPI0025A0A1B1|nr:uncharacterized protein LOC130897186 [Diorhabda carinulata]XP_057661898.1 uncharacterized protein LOC130897186 [Diorhabda carinulata]XP_057661899.1 uncharacterized protein LOC130897186 [Diorhabda carinulata]